MRILILGDGLVARSIKEVQGCDCADMAGHDSFEITDPDSVTAMLDRYEPDVVINTVAFHRLLECEKYPNRAFAVNAHGAGYVARAGIPTVYVSTDYVFENGPEEEVLPGNTPASIYGRSKLGGEIATMEHGGIVVRISGVFGHHASHKGPTFPETVLAGEGLLRLPSDQEFSPTYAPHAAAVLLSLAMNHAMGAQEGGIYHLANEGWTTWAGFAADICAATGKDRIIEPFKAKDPIRPKNSVLLNTRLPKAPHYKQALEQWRLRA